MTEARYCTQCAEDLAPDQTTCPMCDEPSITRADAEEAYWMGRQEGEPPITLDEQHARAFAEHQETHRR